MDKGKFIYCGAAVMAEFLSFPGGICPAHHRVSSAGLAGFAARVGYDIETVEGIEVGWEPSQGHEEASPVSGGGVVFCWWFMEWEVFQAEVASAASAEHIAFDPAEFAAHHSLSGEHIAEAGDIVEPAGFDEIGV